MNPTLAGLIGRHLAAENAQDLPGTLAIPIAASRTWRPARPGGATTAPRSTTGNGGPPSTSR